ncbi:hypothetical protein KVR01_010415 [Diaporthe batatas]|uniref:uncharacterized protein n=1 Tax=Diaporthe batatas TaxID=748121 RepID=UPI001D052F47|nr:uncharacterized protein KVR01_010415 [Diaporthe batatas]KAG8159778.1 hypothetical protein KVR01_010415 [Diaporthe batatas]
MKTRSGGGCETGTKRSQPSVEAESDCVVEPASKKPKPNSSRASPIPRRIDPYERFLLRCIRFNVVPVDFNGDLMVTDKCTNGVYLVDSRALQRASSKLYEQCLAVRPAGPPAHDELKLFPNWEFDGLPDTSIKSKTAMLHLIHANMSKIPELMDFETLQDTVVFAVQYEMQDRFFSVLKRWFKTMPLSTTREKTQRACCFWLSYHIGLVDDFMVFVNWAVFELYDDGEGRLGDPSEELSPGQPLNLSKFRLAEKVVTNRIIMLRYQAVSKILANLGQVQSALLSTSEGSVGDGLEGFGCQFCLNQWYGSFTRGLARPGQACGHLPPEFPSMFPVMEAEDYHRPLAELCNLVQNLELSMSNAELSCTRSTHCEQSGGDYLGTAVCCPPKLIGREYVTGLIELLIEDYRSGDYRL